MVNVTTKGDNMNIKKLYKLIVEYRNAYLTLEQVNTDRAYIINVQRMTRSLSKRCN